MKNKLSVEEIEDKKIFVSEVKIDESSLIEKKVKNKTIGTYVVGQLSDAVKVINLAQTLRFKKLKYKGFAQLVSASGVLLNIRKLAKDNLTEKERAALEKKVGIGVGEIALQTLGAPIETGVKAGAKFLAVKMGLFKTLATGVKVLKTVGTVLKATGLAAFQIALAGFDIYSAVEHFKKLGNKDLTPRERQDAIVLGTLATVGAVVGIVLGIAMAVGAIAGPLGAAIGAIVGVVLGIGTSIYSAASFVDELDDKYNLSTEAKWSQGWRTFTLQPGLSVKAEYEILNKVGKKAYDANRKEFIQGNLSDNKTGLTEIVSAGKFEVVQSDWIGTKVLDEMAKRLKHYNDKYPETGAGIKGRVAPGGTRYDFGGKIGELISREEAIKRAIEKWGYTESNARHLVDVIDDTKNKVVTAAVNDNIDLNDQGLNSTYENGDTIKIGRKVDYVEGKKSTDSFKWMHTHSDVLKEEMVSLAKSNSDWEPTIIDSLSKEYTFVTKLKMGLLNAVYFVLPDGRNFLAMENADGSWQAPAEHTQIKLMDRIVVGVVVSEKQKVRLITEVKNDRVKRYEYELGKRLSSLVMLGGGNDEVTLRKNRDNTAIIESGNKKYTGGHVQDSFVLKNTINGHIEIDAGKGSDTLVVNANEETKTWIDLSKGHGRIFHEKRLIGKNDATLKLTGIENVIGAEGHTDIIIGDDTVNYIDGRGGNDVIQAGGGDDVIAVYQGDDVKGGEGRDVYLLKIENEHKNKPAITNIYVGEGDKLHIPKMGTGFGSRLTGLYRDEKNGCLRVEFENGSQINVFLDKNIGTNNNFIQTITFEGGWHIEVPFDRTLWASKNPDFKRFYELNPLKFVHDIYRDKDVLELIESDQEESLVMVSKKATKNDAFIVLEDSNKQQVIISKYPNLNKKDINMTAEVRTNLPGDDKDNVFIKNLVSSEHFKGREGQDHYIMKNLEGIMYIDNEAKKEDGMYAKDVINLVGVNLDDVSYQSEGDTLQLLVNGEVKVHIEGFYKGKHRAHIALVSEADRVVDLDELLLKDRTNVPKSITPLIHLHYVTQGDSDVTVSDTLRDDLIHTSNGNDVVTVSGGEDNLILGEGQNQVRFTTEADGAKVILSEGPTTLWFGDDLEEIKYSRFDNDLVLNYNKDGKDLSVVLTAFFSKKVKFEVKSYTADSVGEEGLVNANLVVHQVVSEQDLNKYAEAATKLAWTKTMPYINNAHGTHNVLSVYFDENGIKTSSILEEKNTTIYTDHKDIDNPAHFMVLVSDQGSSGELSGDIDLTASSKGFVELDLDVSFVMPKSYIQSDFRVYLTANGEVVKSFKFNDLGIDSLFEIDQKTNVKLRVSGDDLASFEGQPLGVKFESVSEKYNQVQIHKIDVNKVNGSDMADADVIVNNDTLHKTVHADGLPGDTHSNVLVEDLGVTTIKGSAHSDTYMLNSDGVVIIDNHSSQNVTDYLVLNKLQLDELEFSRETRKDGSHLVIRSKEFKVAEVKDFFEREDARRLSLVDNQEKIINLYETLDLFEDKGSLLGMDLAEKHLDTRTTKLDLGYFDKLDVKNLNNVRTLNFAKRHETINSNAMALHKKSQAYLKMDHTIASIPVGFYEVEFEVLDSSHNAEEELVISLTANDKVVETVDLRNVDFEENKGRSKVSVRFDASKLQAWNGQKLGVKIENQATSVASFISIDSFKMFKVFNKDMILPFVVNGNVSADRTEVDNRGENGCGTYLMEGDGHVKFGGGQGSDLYRLASSGAIIIANWAEKEDDGHYAQDILQLERLAIEDLTFSSEKMGEFQSLVVRAEDKVVAVLEGFIEHEQSRHISLKDKNGDVYRLDSVYDLLNLGDPVSGAKLKKVITESTVKVQHDNHGPNGNGVYVMDEIGKADFAGRQGIDTYRLSSTGIINLSNWADKESDGSYAQDIMQLDLYAIEDLIFSSETVNTTQSLVVRSAGEVVAILNGFIEYEQSRHISLKDKNNEVYRLDSVLDLFNSGSPVSGSKLKSVISERLVKKQNDNHGVNGNGIYVMDEMGVADFGGGQGIDTYQLSSKGTIIVNTWAAKESNGQYAQDVLKLDNFAYEELNLDLEYYEGYQSLVFRSKGERVAVVVGFFDYEQARHISLVDKNGKVVVLDDMLYQFNRNHGYSITETASADLLSQAMSNFEAEAEYSSDVKGFMQSYKSSPALVASAIN